MKKASSVIKEIQDNQYNALLKEVYVDESLVENKNKDMSKRLKSSYLYMVIKILKSIVRQEEVKFVEIIQIINMVKF